jgi:hypothetical protein
MIAKYLWIVLACVGVFLGIHFAGDLIKAVFSGLLVAGCLYGAYYEWKKSKSS